jgi:hypothetical protein
MSTGRRAGVQRPEYHIAQRSVKWKPGKTGMLREPTVMMRRAIAALVFASAIVAAGGVASSGADTNGYYPPYNPYPSYALLNALTAIQNLASGQAGQLQFWAQQGNFQPPNPIFTPVDQIEAQIAAMSPPERTAIVSWLIGGGRGALYARNVTDAQIGPCKFPIDPPSCAGGTPPTTQPTDWRNIPFALAPGADTSNGIAIDGGFAVIKNDGTAETHCLTFRNTAQKTAVEVTFRYQLYGASDNMLSNSTSVRTGTFSTGITIAGPASFSDYQTAKGGVGNKDRLQNCWSTNNGIANLSYLQANYMAIQVVGVKYDDGSTWPPQPVHTSGPTPAASPSI